MLEMVGSVGSDFEKRVINGNNSRPDFKGWSGRVGSVMVYMDRGKAIQAGSLPATFFSSLRLE